MGGIYCLRKAELPNAGIFYLFILLLFFFSTFMQWFLSLEEKILKSCFQSMGETEMPYFFSVFR